MKITIIGTGGVGGYFGAKIAEKIKDTDDEIYFLARGEHLKKIKENGITLEMDDNQTINCHPNIASDSLDDFPTPDLVLLCTKSYDLNDICKKLNSHINTDTIVIPLLNGVDIVERIRTNLKKGIVLPSCVYVGTHIKEPGIISQSGGDGIILTGPTTEDPDFDFSSITNLFDNCDIKYKIHDTPYDAIWKKYLFITAFGLVTAYSGKTLMEVTSDSVLTSLVKSILSEIVQIASAKGIRFDENIIEESLKTATKFHTKTSYQRDVEANGKNEGDIFGATIIRMGKEIGIPTPKTEEVFNQIEAN